MSSGSPDSTSADIIELVRFRTERVESRARTVKIKRELLSMRQRLDCHGSIEIHGHSASKARNPLLPASAWDRVATEVRDILEREFGSLRVHRVRDAFIIRHHEHETLIAGILRVQYQARQIELPGQHKEGVEARGSRVLLNWGVGRSLLEAENERLRKRHQRRSRK